MGPDIAIDAELLRAHGAGDQQAFARLYDRYDRPSFQFIRRMLGPGQAEAADDLHQETWLAVSRNAAAYAPAKGSFPTWLFTIARRKVLDHVRRQKVVPFDFDQDNVVLKVPDPGLSPSLQVESRQLAQKLAAAVEALPLEQRAVFILFAAAELTLEEIAEVTGAGSETVKSRLRYARAKLRLALADEWTDHV